MDPLDYEPAGWSLGGLDLEGAWPFARGDQAIREALWNILLTTPGERLMRPEFGAGLRRFVHQPNTETTRRLIASVIERALHRWEPRIELEAVEVSADTADPAQVRVAIRYRILASGSPGGLDLALALGG